MQWETKSFGPTPGRDGQEEQTPIGPIRLAPKPPLPRRVSYLATADASDWDAVTECLAEFWVMVASVLPQYYPGESTPDPLAGEPVPPDNRWDRIVCRIDPGNGKVTTHLWRGAQPPGDMDRVWVTATFPMIIDAARQTSSGKSFHALIRRMRNALVTAASRDRARAALDELRRWRAVHLEVMVEPDAETLRPLFDQRE